MFYLLGVFSHMIGSNRKILTVDAHGLKIARYSVFDCHLSPIWQLMAIKTLFLTIFYLCSSIVLIFRLPPNLVWFMCQTVKFEYKFCPIHDNKMAAKMSAACQFERLDTLTWSFIIQFLPNFIDGLLSSNYCSCLIMGFVLWITSQDCHQNNFPFPLGPFCRSQTVLVVKPRFAQARKALEFRGIS